MSSIQELWWAARHPPADPTHLSFKDKTVLVTGANSGLGHAAAIKYATLGANPLILAVRTVEKGETAKAAIVQATGCSPDIFIIETVDLATFASVKDFASRLAKRVSCLHVAQLAAGLATPQYESGPEGYEMALQVDVISTALMALLLLPLLRAAATQGFVPHLSFVNSISHLDVKADWVTDSESLIQQLDNKAKWDQTKQYYLVKLAGMFVVRGLAERAGRDGVVVNASCPGMCKTNMGRDFPLAQRVFMAIFYIFFGRSAEEGSRSLVSATGLGLESHGKFWTNDKYLPPSQFMESDAGQELYRATWDEILTILRKHVQSDLI